MDEVENPTGNAAPYRKPAVKWLSIAQLVRTAIEILKVSVYAKDKRRREEIADAPCELYQLTTGTEDVRVDFVADTGDGFDATFATALCVARHPGLSITGESEQRRADLLVLGGDLVYPVAKESRYKERFTSVFRHAVHLANAAAPANAGDKKPIVALPGNHDWYDGLNSFVKMMCGPRRKDADTTPTLIPVSAKRDVGGWSAFQSRSYFAVQLTADWWLWGVDSQLDAPIDDKQQEYFRQAKEHLNGADIILCTATPSWLEAAGDDAYDAKEGSPLDSLLVFVNGVLGEERDRVRLLLTGDKHHYAHYVPTENTGFRPELVTCGGGGAFLSSTHHLPETLHPTWQPRSTETDSTHYRLDRAYPTVDESEALVAMPKFLAAGVRNGPTLPALAGGIGAALFWTLTLGFVPTVISTGALFALLGLYAMRGKHKHAPKLRTGLALTFGHTLGHLGMAGLAAWFFTRIVPLGFWWSLPAAFPTLAVLGTGVFVTYLRIADRLGWHTLEAFSGMRIERYKCHLRMRVGARGIDMSVVAMDEATPNLRRNGVRLPKPKILETFRISRRGAPSSTQAAVPVSGQ